MASSSTTEEEEPAGEPGPGGPTGEVGEPVEREIDLQMLAERVYRLLQEEARLERERLGWRHRLGSGTPQV
jgi:hypothetical protein